MYYLNARYYNPEWRRFISPDAADYLDPETPNGLNLYAYCNNDPVNYADPNGHLAFFIATAIVGAIVGFGVAAYNDYASDGVWFNGEIGDYFEYTIGGGLIGAFLGLAASSLLVGNLFASCGQVYVGLQGLAWAYTMGGSSAMGLYIANNFLQSINANASWLGYYPPNQGFIGSTRGNNYSTFWRYRWILCCSVLYFPYEFITTLSPIIEYL